MNKSKQKEIVELFDRWYDWTNFIKLMSDKLFHDSEKYIKEGSNTESEADGEKMKKCAELLKKVCEEDYKFGSEDGLKQKDLEEALDIIKDNLFYWWD